MTGINSGLDLKFIVMVQVPILCVECVGLNKLLGEYNATKTYQD